MLHRKPASRPRTFRAMLLPLAVSVAAVLGNAMPSIADDLAGCWEGCWSSNTNGHSGKLRATITKVDESRYCARFSGTYQRILPFGYRVMLTVKREGDAVTLEGSKDLGLLFGGTFSFDGTATDTEFKATYSSRRDCGEFNMKRVTGCENACR